MAYSDISPTGQGWEAENGDFKVVDGEVQIAADILLSNIGDIKYAPTVGGNARRFLNSVGNPTIIQRAFVTALRSAGFRRPVVDVSEFPDNVSVNNDVVLVGE